MNLLLLLLLLCFVAWRIWRIIRNALDGSDPSIMPKVDEEFRKLVVASEQPELCFDGSTAQIVKEDEDGVSDGNGGYTLMRVFRYARNAHGEYFYFISDGSGKPFFKHIPHANARIVLKKKYIPPTSAR